MQIKGTKESYVTYLSCAFIALYSYLYIFTGMYGTYDSSNYERYLVMHFDYLIPTFSLPRYIYLLIYIFLVTSVCLLIHYRGNQTKLKRAFEYGFILLLTINYFIYIFFHSSTAQLMHIEYKNLEIVIHNSPSQQTSYAIMTFSNSFPSIYLAIAWYIFRMSQQLFSLSKFHIVLYTLGLLSLAGIFLTAHINCILDVVVGILISEICLQIAKRRSKTTYSSNNTMKAGDRIAIYIILIFFLLVFLITLLPVTFFCSAKSF
jgi:hypothetical protein